MESRTVHPGVTEAHPRAIEAHHGVVEDNLRAVKAYPGITEALPGATEAHTGVMKDLQSSSTVLSPKGQPSSHGSSFRW